MKKQKILVLIPARGGSVRVKNKNTRLLAGKPLIAYTIDAAKKAKLAQRIIVSTDSPAIAKIAKKFGAEVPFLRPSEISGSLSTEFEFHKHALDWLNDNEGYVPDIIVNLYPTGPFRTSKSIDNAIKMLLADPSAHSLRSIRKCAEHPFKMWVKKGNLIKPFVDHGNKASHTFSYQMLPEVYIQNASIYIVRTSTLRKFKNTLGTRTIPFVMDEYESTDINSPLDFKFAELLLKKKQSGFPI